MRKCYGEDFKLLSPEVVCSSYLFRKLANSKKISAALKFKRKCPTSLPK